MKCKKRNWYIVPSEMQALVEFYACCLSPADNEISIPHEQGML